MASLNGKSVISITSVRDMPISIRRISNGTGTKLYDMSDNEVVLSKQLIFKHMPQWCDEVSVVDIIYSDKVKRRLVLFNPGDCDHVECN